MLTYRIFFCFICVFFSLLQVLISLISSQDVATNFLYRIPMYLCALFCGLCLLTYL